jgi:hypothetical protein
MSRAWLCRNGRFWRFWGCMQEGRKCIRRAWLWGRCRQSNATRLHPVSLVRPETRIKRTLSLSSPGWTFERFGSLALQWGQSRFSTSVGTNGLTRYASFLVSVLFFKSQLLTITSNVNTLIMSIKRGLMTKLIP